MRRELVPVGETIKVPVVEPAPVAGEAVTLESVVELWATEKKVAKPSKRQMLSKAKRFAAFLENDRQSRGLPPCGDDMGRFSCDEAICYKELLLKPETGFSHCTVGHHIDDLRTPFKFGAKNRPKAIPINPMADVEFKSGDNGRNKWRDEVPKGRSPDCAVGRLPEDTER